MQAHTSVASKYFNYIIPALPSDTECAGRHMKCRKSACLILHKSAQTPTAASTAATPHPLAPSQLPAVLSLTGKLAHRLARSSRACQNICRRRGCLAVQARERSGPSGIHIEGNSPTSPKGWEIMRQKLTDAGVSTESSISFGSSMSLCG